VFFIDRMSTLFCIERDTRTTLPSSVQVLRLSGALFFGAVSTVESVAEELPAGTQVMVLEASRMVLIDSSGLDALKQLHKLLARQQVGLLLCDLNEQPLALMERSGFLATLGERHLQPDLAAALVLAQQMAEQQTATDRVTA
jgi:SulP family sulfate permease